jgi:hypothetical protein
MVVSQSFSHKPPDALRDPSLTLLPFKLGRLTHYAFDAVLISAFLAGVKRSTGLTYVLSILSDH